MKFNELTKTRRSVRGGEKPDLTLKKKQKCHTGFVRPADKKNQKTHCHTLRVGSVLIEL
jgi:hypothetical protein